MFDIIQHQENEKKKSAMKCHLTHVRMVIIKKATDNKFWQGCGEKGILVYYWWGCTLGQPLNKITWSFLK